MTPDEKRIRATALEAEASKLRAEAERESKPKQGVSPKIEPATPRKAELLSEKKRWTPAEICGLPDEKHDGQ